jgi:hypothetical protein
MADDPDHDPVYWIAVTEEWCRDLAQGSVHEQVREMARALVDWDSFLIRRTAERDAEDRKRASTPVKKRKRTAA